MLESAKVIPPDCWHADAEKGPLPTSAALLVQTLEDQHLTERIRRALRATGYGALRTVEVSVTARKVCLAGRVPSYYLFQVAQMTALAVPGTHHLLNGLAVVRPSLHQQEDRQMQTPQQMQPPQPLMNPPWTGRQVAVAAPTVRHQGNKPGILVVDDDHLVRVMLRLGLERHGFAVWLAANGREAIDQYRAHKEDVAVVLLDVRMPELDGPQTLDALREVDPGVVACFMSGDRGAYALGELLRRGAAHFIAKPFLLDDLADILRLLAERVRTHRL